jgi:hypothetical protein
VKWIVFLLVVAGVGFGLWKYGFFDEFMEPWKGWANYIGYFQ